MLLCPHPLKEIDILEQEPFLSSQQWESDAAWYTVGPIKENVESKQTLSLCP